MRDLPSEQFDTVLNRERALLLRYAEVQPEVIQGYCRSLHSDGHWPDIAYSDDRPDNWFAGEHLNRTVELAVAYRATSSPYGSSAELLGAVTRALAYWTTHRFQNSNWWHNDIGVPMLVKDILLYVGDALPIADQQAALRVLDQRGRAKAGDGANTVWEASLGVAYAMFTRDANLAAEQSALIAGEIIVSDGEGIQSDWSFHQHGPRLQQFHYGLSFLEVTSRAVSVLANTPWAIPAEKVDILVNLLLDGDRWMMRAVTTVPSTLDRSVSRPDTMRVDLIPIIDALVDAAADHRQALTEFRDQVVGSRPWITGFRYYPRSEFAVYHRPEYSFFVKWSTPRGLLTESINGENLKGAHLGTGNHFVLRDGNEYRELPPVWDWSLLPGVTLTEHGGTFSPQSFGGSVGDAECGFAAMSYAVADAADHSLAAQKMWSCRGDIVACLIGGLTASCGTARTAMDNCALRGPVFASDETGHVFEIEEADTLTRKLRWVWHAGISYSPLVPYPIAATVGHRSGSWSEINRGKAAETVTRELFVPILDHGAAQSDHSLGYIIAPCPDVSDAAETARRFPFTVLRNDHAMQAVEFDDGIVFAAFYEAGSLSTTARNLTASGPCLV